MSEIKVGDTVRAHYNSGIYIGKVVEDRGERFLVKVLAVQKHPMQGDLHHPGKVDEPGVLFHERKALAFREKMNVQKAVVYPFDDEIPNYNTSIKEAVETSKNKLKAKDTAFNKKALERLKGLEEHYYKKSYY
ncbi:sporulation phosphorelay system protein KapB [Virgibacillus alimentarius]|uniref:Kinase-associated protein B n=1 Tax=Virgibacillus alimentarius TaxID=698769 RepID=A0ABS4S751_9BACI|nr:MULTISPECIES: sporulation phosphorelay system protein KapB [Virgibacillus]MBP2257303.1 kinase-associated protein B [Virgibacillus alimentarius]HLR67865.1 sporulation phosphorelay system protein KapB [Virgibacillus sp.]